MFYSWFVPNIAFPAYDLISRSGLWHEVKQLRRLQWLSEKDLRIRTLDHLRPLLDHAYKNVPFYNRAFQANNLKPADIATLNDLSKVPLLTREQVRNNYKGDLLATGVSPSRKEEFFTSGSSGLPLHFYLDKRAKIQTQASSLFFREWAGVNTWDTRIWIAAPVHFFSFLKQYPWHIKFGRRYILGENAILTPGMDLTLTKFLERIQKLPKKRDYWINGFPSYIGWLAKQLGEHDCELARLPKAVMTYAEPLTAQMAQRINKTFGCPVHNIYGIQETQYFAQSCPDYPENIHINSEYALVRIVGEKGIEVEPGQTGRVLITDLHNMVMPFINYDIGDLAVKGAPCPCGRGLPTIQAIQGRVGELIHTPDGRKIPPIVFGNYLVLVKKYVPFIWEFQVLQSSLDQITMLIVPTKAYTMDHEARLIKDLRGLLGPGVAITLECVDQIPKEPSGKQLVVRSFL